VGDPIQTVGEMLWYMERSPLMNHTIIGFATKLLYDNINHIKKEIKKYDSIKDKK
jgi:hypothetical protein